MPDKSSDSVLLGMLTHKEEYGEKFPEIFKTITFDNDTEFSSCSEMEAWGTTIYFAPPYSSWEYPVNERTNRMLRAFIKKGNLFQTIVKKTLIISLTSLTHYLERVKIIAPPRNFSTSFLMMFLLLNFFTKLCNLLLQFTIFVFFTTFFTILYFSETLLFGRFF